ncbi:MAG TPA: DUF2922 domain-containing protein [Clostridiales bacterium]|nr:DUF2922 domain-containing protein [Clostridiales bacterium]
MNQTLVLVFLDAEGKERNIRIDDPKSDLEPTEVETAMNSIVSKNIFAGSAFVSAAKAYIITTTTEDIYDQAV